MACVASGNFFERGDKLPRSRVFGKLPARGRRGERKLPGIPFSRNFVMRARLFIDSITSCLPTVRPESSDCPQFGRDEQY